MGAVVLLGGRCAQLRAAQRYLVLHLLERHVVAVGSLAAFRDPWPSPVAPIQQNHRPHYTPTIAGDRAIAPLAEYRVWRGWTQRAWHDRERRRLDSVGRQPARILGPSSPHSRLRRFISIGLQEG